MKNFLTSFSKNKKKSTNLEIDINLAQLDKYSQAELIEFIRQYEKYAASLQTNINDQQTMIDELNKDRSNILEENQNFLESKDIFADDAKHAMLNYQKLMDASDSIKYMENFAEKQIKNTMNLENGTVLQNDIKKMSQEFNSVVTKFENVSSDLEKIKQANENNDFSQVSTELKKIEAGISQIQQFFDGDIEVVNDNISMIIERFDSLCDEQSIMYSNNTQEELKTQKGFIFLTDKKYQELASLPISLKIQVKELDQRLKKSEKKLEKSEEIIKSLQNVSFPENNLNVTREENKGGSDRRIGSDRQIPEPVEGSQPETEHLQNQVDEINSELEKKSKLLDETIEVKEVLLSQLCDMESTMQEKASQAESILKQEILKREQIEKDYNKLFTKDTEIQNYLREEVERTTNLENKNELLDIKYKKVKIALKEISNKFKEREGAKLKSQISDEQINDQENCKVELKNKNDEVSELQIQIESSKNQNNEYRIITNQNNIELAQKDNDYNELKRILEEKLEIIENINERNLKLTSKSTALQVKRERGIKEIKKLQEKIESQQTEISLKSKTTRNSYFNTNPSSRTIPTSLRNNEVNYSYHGNSTQEISIVNEKNIGDILEVLLSDMQKVYKRIVLMLPLSDKGANESIITVEKNLNSIINKMWDHIADA